MIFTGFNGPRLVSEVPNFVRAKTANGLVLAMRLNNLRFKSIFNYQYIAFDPNDRRWYAWFRIDAESIAKAPKPGGDK